MLTKYGGNLGSSGCVAYLFEKRGVMTFERRGLDADALLEAAARGGRRRRGPRTARPSSRSPRPRRPRGGARRARGGGLRARERRGLDGAAGTVKLQGEQAKTMLELADALEDLDDVQGVYANFDISDEEMARLASTGLPPARLARDPRPVLPARRHAHPRDRPGLGDRPATASWRRAAARRGAAWRTARCARRAACAGGGWRARSLQEVIGDHAPDGVVVEQVFVAASPRSALVLGQARGVALAGRPRRALAVYEYERAEHHQAGRRGQRRRREGAGAAHGRALLALGARAAPDAADALAAAICHLPPRRPARRRARPSPRPRVAPRFAMIGARRLEAARRREDDRRASWSTSAGSGYEVLIPLSTFAPSPRWASAWRCAPLHRTCARTRSPLRLRTTASAPCSSSCSTRAAWARGSRSALSGLEPDELLAAIRAGDARAPGVSGVGASTAERMVLELRERALELIAQRRRAGAPWAAGRRRPRRARSALVNLGFRPTRPSAHGRGGPEGLDAEGLVRRGPRAGGAGERRSDARDGAELARGGARARGLAAPAARSTSSSARTAVKREPRGLRRGGAPARRGRSTTCSSTARPGLGKTSLAGIVAARDGRAASTSPAVRCSSARATSPRSSSNLEARRRPLHRRDPPPHRRGRGGALPGDGGLPARRGARPGAFGAVPAARPAALHAVGATTRTGLLTAPLRGPLRLCCTASTTTRRGPRGDRPRSARLLGVEIDGDGSAAIAARSRGTPRIANRLLRRVRDFAQVRGHATVDRAVAEEALELLEVDELGLDELDRQLLRAARRDLRGRPRGAGDARRQRRRVAATRSRTSSSPISCRRAAQTHAGGGVAARRALGGIRRGAAPPERVPPEVLGRGRRGRRGASRAPGVEPPALPSQRRSASQRKIVRRAGARAFSLRRRGAQLGDDPPRR